MIVQNMEFQEISYALAASPDYQQDRLVFWARSSGLFRSEDGGINWQPAYATLPLDTPLPTTAVAFSPNFASDQTLFAGVFGAVLCSIDRGVHWKIMALPAPPPLVSALAISPNYAQDGVVLAGTIEDGVFRSASRGDYWAIWNFGLLDRNILCMAISPAFAQDETLWIGTETGIFRTTNGGRSWREVDFPAGLVPVTSLAVAPRSGGTGRLYALSQADGLFVSKDGGENWLQIGREVIAGGVSSIGLEAHSAQGDTLLVAQGTSVWLSRDGGQHWTEMANVLAAENGPACLATPLGMHPGAPLLIGQEKQLQWIGL